MTNAYDKLWELGAAVGGATVAIWRFLGGGERRRFHRENQELLHALRSDVSSLHADIGGMRSDMRDARREVQALRSAFDQHVQKDESFEAWTRDELLRKTNRW